MEKKVVLIDDNPVIRHLNARLFQKAGYVICTAEDGKSGFEAVKEQNPDTAVIDYHLPDIDGPEIARMIKEDKELEGSSLFCLYR